MIKFWNNLINDEDGAVTVDWVVLTAAVCGLCIGFIAELKSNSDGLAGLTQTYLETQDPATGGTIQEAAND